MLIIFCSSMFPPQTYRIINVICCVSVKMGSEDVQFRNEKQNKKPKTNNQRKPTNPTLLLDLCSVRKRLLAVCHAQCSDTWHSVWNTEALRGSGEHPQEAVWLRSECTWNTNSSFHSCAGTTPACLFQITNPGSTAETQPQSLCSHLLLWVLFFQVLLTFQNFR